MSSEAYHPENSERGEDIFYSYGIGMSFQGTLLDKFFIHAPWIFIPLISSKEGCTPLCSLLHTSGMVIHQYLLFISLVLKLTCFFKYM